jgi:RHH-type proline utilization regulon transcriptional repressor/proline dehydrogenase/delta 1-pyrroline-5-carboxylate dehydrogenase
VGDVYASARFRRQLVDAASSLVTGPACDLSVTMPPLIGPPGADLERALTTLDAAEEWLLKPVLLDAQTHLWSPGIKVGVQRGSWFHQTECFGPVLGLMAAADLEEALSLQNATEFGLTGGLHSLDPDVINRWVEDVQIGNAYVNRAITGAVVQRQPFGGWKGSVVGPGAKAGGPNYLAQLGKWRDAELPRLGEVPFPLIAELVESLEEMIAPDRRAWLQAAVRSDKWWLRNYFGEEHDEAGLFCEANVLRYRPFARLAVRAEGDTALADFVRVFAAVMSAGCELDLSVPPGPSGELDSMLGTRETSTDFVARMRLHPPDRIRVLGTLSPALVNSELPCFVDARPPVADGRIEGLRYRREQAISRTLHRFGNLIRT